MEQELKRNGINKMPLFIISGDRPAVDSFKYFPAYIQFDGRPKEVYTEDALSKVAFVSDYFVNYSKWKGKGSIPKADKEKIKAMVDHVHQQGKLVRFWKIPDTPKAWKKLRKLGVDVMNTDFPTERSKRFNKIGL